jgi:hypothetical protein
MSPHVKTFDLFTMLLANIRWRDRVPLIGPVYRFKTWPRVKVELQERFVRPN